MGWRVSRCGRMRTAGCCSTGSCCRPTHMSGRKLVLTVAGVALPVGVALGMMLQRPHAVERTSGQLPAITLRGASIVLRHHGQKQAEVRADRVEVSRDLRYATFTGSPTVAVDRKSTRLNSSHLVIS